MGSRYVTPVLLSLLTLRANFPSKYVFFIPAVVHCLTSQSLGLVGCPFCPGLQVGLMLSDGCVLPSLTLPFLLKSANAIPGRPRCYKRPSVEPTHCRHHLGRVPKHFPRSAMAAVPHLHWLHAACVSHKRVSQLRPASHLPGRLHLVHRRLCLGIYHSAGLLFARFQFSQFRLSRLY